MMNLISVRFTIYDENGVAACTEIVNLEDINDIFKDGFAELKHSQYLMLMRGVVIINEFQRIADSVCVASLKEDDFYEPISYLPKEIFAEDFDFRAALMSRCIPVDWLTFVKKPEEEE